jgi:hypothetical protein
MRAYAMLVALIPCVHFEGPTLEQLMSSFARGRVETDLCTWRFVGHAHAGDHPLEPTAVYSGMCYWQQCIAAQNSCDYEIQATDLQSSPALLADRIDNCT